jgi:DNA-binding GntR family transcriptional regulator
MDELGPLDRPPAPLRRQLVDTLRREIVAGRWKPGERLIERELCEAFGVSRALVREAIRQLEGEDLLEVVPYRGPVVATLDATTARHLFGVRSALEGHAAATFAARHDPAAKRALKAAAAGLGAALRAADRPAIIAAKAAWYDALLAGAANPVLDAQVRQLLARMAQLWSSSLGVPGRPAAAAAEIRAIAAAIERGDAAAARAAAEAFLTSAAAIVDRTLAKDSAA